MRNKYKHIIWDWNGTLFNDVHYAVDIMNILLKEENKDEICIEKYKEVFKFPVIDYYRELGLGLTNEEFFKVGARFIELYESNKLSCNLFNDVNDTINYLKTKNIKQSVLSAYSQDKLIELLNYYKISENMEKIVGQNNIYADGKIELGEKLVKEIYEEKDSILLIGDTDHDFEVAQKMEVKCVLVNRGHQNVDKLKKTNTLVIENFEELVNILE